jgi:hypothetical protein|tara:strand:- start:976 stop:1293 length:318 start_codon:yes stop_codon:yes gene_type:complete
VRLRVQGDAGSLARHPEAALDALADVAVADGADREEWLAKAIRAAGGATQHVHVNGNPRFQIIRGLEPGVRSVHGKVISRLLADIEAVLVRAADRAATGTKDLME